MNAESVMGCGRADTTVRLTSLTGSAFMLFSPVLTEPPVSSGCARLLEPMRVSGRVIPRNTLLVGAARLQGERLGIGITSLEHGGNIIPVELEVYDSDGQAGIFIPGSMEIDAAKEIGANMGSSLGSSINISTDAGAQLASDLGRGAIQGISQYISKRMRTVKVHLKSGYRVLLYQEKE